ncbi:MAG: hypothetical protein ACFCVH_07855 [Alphaproteobacteria bacterium]
MIRQYGIASALALCLAAPAASAQEPAAQCFARAYDAAHLAAHPGQLVVEMLLVLRPYVHDGRDYADATIRAMVRDRFGEFFANSGSCQDLGGGSYDCGIECDGGQFSLGISADGSAMLRNEAYGFVLYGGCGEEVEENRVIRIEADAEHRAFRLYPVPMEACPHDLWLAYDHDEQ